MIEKRKTKQKGWLTPSRQAKDKHSAKKTMGVMQTRDQNVVSEYMLHMWADAAFGIKLAHGSPMEQSFTWCLLKIRLAGTPTTVLQLQYKPRGNGSGLLRKNVKRGRPRIHDEARSRSKDNRKSTRSLSKFN